MMLYGLIPLALIVPACMATGERDYEGARERMVATQLVARDITDPRVLAAMRAVPRHELVPEQERDDAYADYPLPIGYGQTISQPYIVAFMTQMLNPQPGQRGLEVGTGSGYQAAVLARLVKELYSVEIVEPLGRRAMADLARLKIENVKVKVGDGYAGWAEHAPFDFIIVTCAPDHVPPPLVEQLAPGGRMIIPVTEERGQQLYLLEKRGGELVRRAVLPVKFVPLTRPNSRATN